MQFEPILCIGCNTFVSPIGRLWEPILQPCLACHAKRATVYENLVVNEEDLENHSSPVRLTIFIPSRCLWHSLE